MTPEVRSEELGVRSGPTEVMKYLPVTVRFDGCYCDSDCFYAGGDWCALDDVTGRDDTPSLGNRGYFKVRSRWCCETFGMGGYEPMPGNPQFSQISQETWAEVWKYLKSPDPTLESAITEHEPLEGWMNE